MSFTLAAQQTPSPRPTSSYGSSKQILRPSSRKGYQSRTLTDRSKRASIAESLVRQSPTTDLELQSYDEGSMDTPDLRATLRSRPSWLKRLSNVSSSRDSSPSSSLRPASPSIFSNGSTSFSNAGSTAPILGYGAPAPLPRNKLVKRSASFRDPAFRPTGSKVPTLRRPVTSHQRSATLQHDPNLFEIGSDDGAQEIFTPPITKEPQIKWRHFFGAKTLKVTEPSRKHRLDEGRNIRRVVPDETCQPTLLMAKTIQTSSLEIDESVSQDNDSVFFGSRPATPAGVAQFLSSPHNVAPSNSPQDESLRQRRSFSLGDFMSTPPQLFKLPNSSKASRSKLLRRSGKRISSAPNPSTMGSWLSVDPKEDIEPPPKRRDLSYSEPLAGKQRKLQLATGPGRFRHVSTPPVLVDSANGPNLSRASVTPRNYRPSSAKHSLPSPINGVRSSRLSIEPSDRASTLVGSENENRALASPDDDDFDGQSDTAYDSIRTGATKSSSGVRGPRLETIFNETPPPLPNTFKVHAVRDLLPKGTFQEQNPHIRQTIKEEEESVHTPVHTVMPTDRQNTDSPASTQRRTTPPLFPDLPPSPPEKARPLSLGTLEWDPQPGDDGSMWSIDDDEGDKVTGLPTLPVSTLVGSAAISSPNIPLSSHGRQKFPTTPQKPATEHQDMDTKPSIFDWSEQPTDRTPDSNTPPRPRTVHGKKDAEMRGSRSVCRRNPSAVHARSQSVPVVPDVNGKREQVVMNKFGTWGVGSKGVSEDWNDDFDFSAPEDTEAKTSTDVIDARADSGMAMFVPHSIREQQNNVLANIGLLKEWGILIEELKELRVRAVSLRMLEGPHAGTWKEVDAMIELADQEQEGASLLPQRSPTSSPGRDVDGFDEPAPATATNGRKKRRSGILPEDDIFNRESPTAAQPDRLSPKSSATTPHIRTRPRKDSEAVAKSVIEALRHRRLNADAGLDLQPVQPSKKVPFDTATLKHIVPYVSGLMRKVKEGLREVEGLHTISLESPKVEGPALAHIFRDRGDESPMTTPSRQRSKTQHSPPKSTSEPLMSGEKYKSKENELAQQMQLMTVM
ncbi:MAG: hypothetical protein M1822_006019 [Bathelium mastoideum]|nr:MAG: hypothetical protein M1822_006019 [Bathelium mastoideum]